MNDVDRGGPGGSRPDPRHDPEARAGGFHRLDHLLALGAGALGVPCGFVSAIDEGGYGVLACSGIDAERVDQDPSLAEMVMSATAPIVVRDASLDPDLQRCALVAGAPGVRFFAGVPFRTPDGIVGALCLADVRPRAEPTEEELTRLVELGAVASDLIHLHRSQDAVAAELAERDAIERRLRNSERRTRLIIHESGEGFISIDGQSCIQEWNRKAEQIFGWGRDEVLGAKLTETIIPPEYRDAHRAGMARFMKTGEGDLLFRLTEVPALHRDGHEFPIEINIWPVQVGDESTFHAFVRDITARRQTEEAHKQAKEAAEAADRAKSEFLSRMSHELRTPLNAILGFSQLLEMDELTPEQMDSLAEIRKGGRHLLGLINEVLDIARIESGRLSLSIEPVYLVDVVRHVVGLLRSLAVDADVSLVVDDSSLRRFVSGDHQRLSQVLLNLVSNAIKYNETGGTVVVRAREEYEGLVHIDVTDTGKGIDPARMDRLFTPFDRLGAEQTTVEGSGLGLALSRTLVEAMEGEISAKREKDGGMTFTVTLATASSQLSQIDVDADEPQALPVVKLSARHTILYIEDNLSNLKLIEQTLGKEADVQLLTAIQGGMGFHLAREHRPDLILLDLHLPDIPGHSVLRQLQEEPRTKDIPVIVLSADATAHQVERLLAAGARAYITKPLDLAELRRLVGEAVASLDVGADEGGRGDVTTSS